jgi:hypothetical protein
MGIFQQILAGFKDYFEDLFYFGGTVRGFMEYNALGKEF